VAGENVEGDNVDLGGYEPTQPKFDLEIDDPHYLKPTIESKIFLSEGCALNRLIGTLMILNTCATTTRNLVVCNQSLCNWHATSCGLYLGHVCNYKFGIV